MSRTLWIIVGIGVVLRIILAAISFHADILSFDFAGYVLQHTSPAQFYDYLSSLPAADPILKLYPKDYFIYPPLFYFLIGGGSLLLTWMTDATIHQKFLFDIASVLGDPRVMVHLLLLKVPFFVFDGLAGYFLSKLFTNPKEKFWALVLWVFNPVTLFATYMMGQFDIIPTFFSILALWVLQRRGTLGNRDIYLAALVLGLGSAFKISPLFFVIPLLSLTAVWRTRIIAGAISVATYLVPVVPFLFSHGYRMSALVANQTMKSLYPQIAISGGESIFLFGVSLLFFYWVYLSVETTRDQLWQRFFASLLLFFMFTHYHPQWFVWLTPFLVLDLVHSHFKHLLYVIMILVSYFGSLLFFDQGLTFGLLAPLNPQLYNGPTLWQMLHLNVDYNFWRSVLQTLLFSVGLYYLYVYFPVKGKSVWSTK